MNDDLEQLLRNLRLHTVAERFEDHLALAEAEGRPFATWLAGLLRDEWHARQHHALTRRIKNARMPETWTLESFPFQQHTGVDRRRIRTLAELDFVSRAENVVFIGPTGVGKTGLASALLLKALQNGSRGLFIRAQDLFDQMYASLADRSSRQLLNQLIRVDVLLIDELGYLNLRDEQINIFFKLMDERHHHRPTLITTNLDYVSWPEFLGNQALVEALLSRLRERCHTIRIDGPCLRAQQG